MYISEMRKAAEKEGYSIKTFNRARYELKDEDKIDIRQYGFGGSKKWYAVALDLPKEWDPRQEY